MQLLVDNFLTTPVFRNPTREVKRRMRDDQEKAYFESMCKCLNEVLSILKLPFFRYTLTKELCTNWKSTQELNNFRPFGSRVDLSSRTYSKRNVNGFEKHFPDMAKQNLITIKVLSVKTTRQ